VQSKVEKKLFPDEALAFPSPDEAPPHANLSLPGRGVPLPFLQKRASFARPFLLTDPAKSRVLLFDAS
jgi:hypothetical protein